jgi:hypothetical protein
MHETAAVLLSTENGPHTSPVLKPCLQGTVLKSSRLTQFGAHAQSSLIVCSCCCHCAEGGNHSLNSLGFGLARMLEQTHHWDMLLEQLQAANLCCAQNWNGLPHNVWTIVSIMPFLFPKFTINITCLVISFLTCIAASLASPRTAWRGRVHSPDTS